MKKRFLFIFCVWAVFLACVSLRAEEKTGSAARPDIFPRESFGKALGPALVWDFTKGELPANGKLRKFSELREGTGLVPTALELETEAGFRVSSPEDFELPDAFFWEAEVVPGLEWKDEKAAETAAKHRGNVLWDSMYITYVTDPEDARCHRGFQVNLIDCGNGLWQPVLHLGFGRMTDCVRGPRVAVKPGETVRLGFFFDANRSVTWFFEGQKVLGTVSASGPIAPEKYSPVIGDRYGSNYCPFNGIVKRVALTPYERRPIGVSFSGRGAFERGEKDAKVTTRIENFSAEEIQDIRVEIVQKNEEAGVGSEFGSEIPLISQKFAELGANGTAEVVCPVETCVKPGWYSIEVRLSGKKADGSETSASQELKVGIGPVFADRFPALIWMFNNRPYEEVLDFGFTHGLTSFGYGTPEKVPSLTTTAFEQLDKALVDGFRLVKSVYLAYPKGKTEDDFLRFDRNESRRFNSKGKGNPEASDPALHDLAREIAKANAEIFGTHPAFGGILPNSERRDGTFPSFRTEMDRYRAETGKEVPAEVTHSTAPRDLAPKRFPDGIVPDDDPILNYYRWFWAGGDGWPGINSASAREYRKVAGRFRDGSEMQKARPFFSFYDPSVRVPPKWGSGGDVDVLSQWVYAYPEPMNVAGPTEELFAMAGGTGQDVMVMTQIICYRSQIAPKNVPVKPTPQWVKEKPDADFPTIPPDTLQEATWAMLAKPVQGIMYHGYACIAETGAQTGYVYTNDETPERMRHLMKNVVAPLGPTLKHLPRAVPPVAVLESFTSAIFAGTGTWGWRAPDLTFLQRARLDPRVVYEETVLRDGLDDVKVLYVPQAPYLTLPVIERIRKFQADGGILIGDEMLCRALKADILVPVNKVETPKMDSLEEVDKMARVWVNTQAQEFTRQAKETSIANVETLRKALDPHFLPRADSSSPELFTFARQWEGVDYLFVINDRRTFGDYVGQWGLTMEKGLPFEGSATMADTKKEIRAVYELSRGGEIPFTRTDDGMRVQVPLKYETNDGRLLLFLKSKIASLDVKAPASLKRGDVCRVELQILDADGKPVHALLPAEIRLFDANGKELDGAGFVCAKNGVCTLEILTNRNDPAGGWRLWCRDRASGLTKEIQIPVSN